MTIFKYFFYLAWVASSIYGMNGQSNPPSAYHGLLVLSDTRSSTPRSGLGFQLTLSNQVYRSQMQAMPRVESVSQSLSPRTLVQRDSLSRPLYIHKIDNLKSSLDIAAKELQALTQNTKQDFAVSLYLHLQDIIKKASDNKIPQPVVRFMCDSLVKLEPYLFDKNGSVKVLSASDIKNIQSIINDCKSSFIRTIETAGDQWCAYDALDDVQNLERLQQQGVLTLNRGINILFGLNDSDSVSYFGTVIARKDFTQAWNAIKGIGHSKRAFFEAVYHRCYRENFNSKGIDFRFMGDPFAQDLAKRLPDSVIPSVHNIELRKRCIEKDRFLDKCGIGVSMPAVEIFAYQLVDAPQLSLAQKVEKVCQFVSVDSENNGDRQTYAQLYFANGLPRLAKYNKEVLEAQFPDSFHTVSHVQDRILIAKLGLLDSANPMVKEYINRAVDYIRFGCSDNPLAHDVGRIGHALGQAVLNSEKHWCLSLPNMLAEPQNEHFARIKQEVVKYLGANLAESDSHCAKVGMMYERMIRGDEIAQSFLEQALLTGISEKILAIDIFTMHREAVLAGPGQHTEITIKQFEKLAEAYRDVQNNGIVYSEKACAIDLKTRLFMHVKGEKYGEHCVYRGNQLEHAIHENILENYQRGACLKEHKNQPHIKPLERIAKKSNMLADQSLQVRDYANAINLAAFAGSTYDYIESFGKYLAHAGTQIVEGSVEGAIAGVKSIAHQVAHPIETVQNVARGLGNLAILACRMHNHPPSYLPLLKDPASAREYYVQYYREIGVDIEALENSLSQMTLKDAAKATAQFVTEGVLAGEIFKFSGLMCQTLKLQAQLLAHDAQLINVSDKVAVAAATEIEVNAVRVSAEAGVTKISSQTIDRIKNIIATNSEFKGFKNIAEQVKTRVAETKIGSVADAFESYEAYLKAESQAEMFYKKMRVINDDIVAISKNTGIAQSTIEKIKSHIFTNNHNLRDGIKKFAADMDMAKAWQRLMDGNFVKSDVILLEHELLEALLEAESGHLELAHIHSAVEEFCNWRKTL